MEAAAIFKIYEASAWAEAEGRDELPWASVDREDGFVHFSTAAQVRETAERHFRGCGALVLVAVDSARVGNGLRWEPSRGGAMFPHVYGTVPRSAVSGVWPLRERESEFEFPEELAL